MDGLFYKSEPRCGLGLITAEAAGADNEDRRLWGERRNFVAKKN
jgi:hypothetical protein